MLEMIAECVGRGESFAIETTLSGRTYARMIPQRKQAGYQVALFFLQLPNEDLAVKRVADRVAQGGHNIPEPGQTAGRTGIVGGVRRSVAVWGSKVVRGENGKCSVSSSLR